MLLARTVLKEGSDVAGDGQVGGGTRAGKTLCWEEASYGLWWEGRGSPGTDGGAGKEARPQGPLSPGARQRADRLQRRLTFAAFLGTGPPEPGASWDNRSEPPGTHGGCTLPAHPPSAPLATETRPLPCPRFVPPRLPSPAARPPRGLLRPSLMYAATVHCGNWYSSAQLLRTYKLPRNFSGRESSRGSGSRQVDGGGTRGQWECVGGSSLSAWPLAVGGK